MSDNYKGYVVLEGISPLMMHAMSKDTVINVLIRGERKPIDKTRPIEQIAEEALYKDDDGNIGIPAECVFASLREAGRRVKVGSKAVSTATTTTLPSFLSLDGTFFVLDNQKWEPDVRRGMMEGGGKTVAVGIVRPKFKTWSIKVPVEISENEGATKETVKRLFEVSGAMVGLCSFRPERNGQFGRYRVKEFNVQKVMEESRKAA